MIAAKELVVLWFIGLLQGCSLAGIMVKANLQLFLEFEYKKRDENLSCGAKVGGGSATFGHYEQEKSQIGWF